MIKWLTILGAGVLLTGCMQQPAAPATNNQTETPTSAVVPSEAEGTMEPSQPSEMEDNTGSTPSGVMGKTSAVKEFTVEGSNFKFVPATLKVKVGNTVRVTFKNTGGTHDFKIDEFKVATKQIAGGKSEVVEFVADKAGTYEYYCSVGQHRKMGMVGKLVVE